MQRGVFMSEATVRKQRPKHLALNQIRLPLPGIVSILHRVSGAGLFLLLPFLLYLLDRSLGSAETFETFSAVVGHPLVKLLLLGLRIGRRRGASALVPALAAREPERGHHRNDKPASRHRPQF